MTEDPETGNMRQVRPLVVNAKDGSVLALIPGGKFVAGEEKFSVELPPFYLGLTAVTNAQYLKFVEATGHRCPDHADSSFGGGPVWKGKSFPAAKAEQPVVCVSWEDASAYCAWAGLRLPGELEWEQGARGMDGREYPWGNEWDQPKCRNDKNKGSETTASVWAYPSGLSPWGLYQMAGNVWEWCGDWYDSAAYARYKSGNLTPPASGSGRVVRGGSWTSSAPRTFGAPPAATTTRRAGTTSSASGWRGLLCKPCTLTPLPLVTLNPCPFCPFPFFRERSERHGKIFEL